MPDEQECLAEDVGEEEEEQDDANVDPEWAALRAMLHAAREQGLMEGREGDGEEEDEVDDQTTLIIQAAHDCVEAGDEEALVHLLDELKESGVDIINTPHPSDGDHLVHIASLYGHLVIVQLLIKRGARAGAVNEQDGSTALHDAAAGGYLEICEVLLKEAPETLPMADHDKDTPLHCAARGNHASVVRLLLSNGGDPGLVNNEGKTPAAEAEDQEVVELLVKAAMERQLMR